MKVLIVQPHLSTYGGAETVIVKLANFLKKSGVEVAVICLSLSPAIERECTGIRFILPRRHYPFKPRSANFIDSIGVVSEILALTALVRRNHSRYDLVNVHNFPTTWTLVFNRRPNVWMCNEPPDFYNNPRPSLPVKILRASGIKLDAVIVRRFVGSLCVADRYNYERAKSRYNRDAEIINYGIDFEFFSEGNPSGVIQKYGLADKFVLLQSGAISPQKNQIASIEVVEHLKEEIPNIRLVLAGQESGPYKTELLHYIREKKLQDSVIFTGHLSKEELRDLYHAGKIAIFPVKVQGGWLSPFEAICAGTPVIVSTTMGAASLIVREKLGIVTDDFPSGVRDIHNNLSFYKNRAEKARHWVAANLTWEKFSSKMLSLFEETLQAD